MIFKLGDHVANVHTEHKIKRKGEAGLTVAIVTEPEDKRYSTFFFQEAANATQNFRQIRVYNGVRSRKEDRVKAQPSICDDLRLKLPFSCLVTWPTGSSKSSFSIRFLQIHKELCTERKFNGVVGL